MKKHIVRVIAIVTATLMLLSIIPAAALQELSLPNLMSAVTGSSEIGSAEPSLNGDPAQNTQEQEESVQGDAIVDNDDYDFAADVTLGKDYSAPSMMATGPDMASNDGLEADGTVNKSYSPYEPYYTELEDHPFLPYGSAWMDLSKIYYGAPATQNFPFTKWSANTSVYNITGTGEKWGSGKAAGKDKYVFPDKDLIDGYTWAEYNSDDRLKILQTNADGTPKTDSKGNFLYYTNTEHGAVSSNDVKHGAPIVTSRNDKTAYAYNRYDAMQGKYGITIDKNAKSVVWAPSWVENYYGDDEPHGNNDYYASVLYLSDTPYLYFSTEAPDSQKLAISLLIGTPIQKEVLAPVDLYPSQTSVTGTNQFEYRWYTITDNSARPGIANDTRDNSMIPYVTVSDVVYVGTAADSYAASQQNSVVNPAVVEAGKNDPIALAAAKGINTETLFVDGAITGCIDFTNILPLVMAQNDQRDVEGNPYNNGREDVQYKISQIRVDSLTKEGAEDSAARINYLYFGPSLVTTYTPQNTGGSEFSGQAWQHAQTNSGVGNSSTAIGDQVRLTENTERAYTSGWENGAAVSIENTPNKPQLMTVDIHGKGDGQLIEWSAVPSGANVIHGSQKSSRPSKVWKFTDNDGNVQYMEAECDDAKEYYVTVTVPVRKWVNVLGEARKLSFNATLLHKGTNGKSPSFGFWGNETGSLGAGHSGTTMGARFKNEDILIMFGERGMVYHVDEGQTYHIAEVDSTTGDSLFYNAEGGHNESWFDLLRSPYVYGETVTGANVACYIDSAHIGYTFVTSIRFSMPIGSAITLQNMKGDGNSAGLNTYSTSGAVVSAYDGGSGVQPNINVTSSLPEKNVTVKYDGSGKLPTDFTYTQANNGDGTIKGSITSKPAAYGPMLHESFYTIYDLLDTEMMWESSRESHDQDNKGKNHQIVYGERWRVSSGVGDLPIHYEPKDSSTIYGYVRSDGSDGFTAYARVNLLNSSGSRISSWVLVGVVTSGGTPEIGWVKLWEAGKTAYCTRVSGRLYKEEDIKESTFFSSGYHYSYVRNIIKGLRNNWVLSNISGSYSGFRGVKYNETTNKNEIYDFSYGNGSNKYNYPKDIYNYRPNNADSYNGPTLQYANMWAQKVTATNSGENLSDTYLRTVNGTDLEFGFKRNNNSGNNLSVGITRILKDPVVLAEPKVSTDYSYPVFYVDYSGTEASGGSLIIALSVLIDNTPKLYHVYGSSGLTEAHHGAHEDDSHFMYYSFEDIMTANKGKKISVTGISLYMWNPPAIKERTITIRRAEIWQGETEWLDSIISDNQSEGGNSSTSMVAPVKDSMNIINDAFFHYHNENTDGGYTITNTGTLYTSGRTGTNDDKNIGINDTDRAYKFTITNNTNANSFKKTNSNKGWKAYIRIDANSDNVMDSNDPTYYSYNGTSSEGVYEYRTALGHLRVWSPANSQTSVVFESDRSFSTKNYKYLYYSYSMRDVETGISAEENDDFRSDGLEPGIAVAIKSNQLGSHGSYSEIVTADGTRTWAYYSEGNSYWAEDGRDNRTFKTTINAAVDLSTFDSIESVNQFVFYLNNPLEKQAEFYINYLYLSNVPPTELIKTQLEEEQYQYYYMMDNTGDRYSARFPTIDNPTGQVSGLNSDNDRVNPIVVERGEYLAYGTYFNGDPISGYGTGTRDYDETVGSVGYYEKDYGGQTPMKNIMFYAGGNPYDVNKDTDITDIKDYYDYKEMNGDGVADIYDMKWSYGRWDDGQGEAGRNTMYIDPNVEGVSGNLTRRYATENYVLLRAGITPKKYLTYFDAQGGQMKYDTSSDDIKNGIIQNDNNYYITETAVFDYFKGPKITAEQATNIPTKYGFVFDGWIHDSSVVEDDKGQFARLYVYTKKAIPGLNYFYADWQEDPAYADVTHTVTFINPERGGKDVWYTREANIGNEFQMLMPDMTRATVNGKAMRVVGWRVKGDADGVVYMPGSWVTITDSVTFEAVTQNITDSTDTSDYTHSVTVATSTIKMKIVRDLNDLTNVADPEALGIKRAGKTYYNIPHGTVVLLVHDKPGTNYGWMINLDADGVADGVNAESQAVCSTNYKHYMFSVLSDVSISYTQVNSLLDLDSGEMVKSSPVIYTTAAETTVNTQNMYGREMKFYTQFDLSNISGAELVCYGTLYTKSGSNYDSIKAKLNEQMRLDENTITDKTIGNGAFGTLTTAVRQVKASKDAANSSNQYYLMVTENKGNEVTYYARGYVIYKVGGAYKVAYSDTVARSYVPAAANLTEDA